MALVISNLFFFQFVVSLFKCFEKVFLNFNEQEKKLIENKNRTSQTWKVLNHGSFQI